MEIKVEKLPVATACFFGFDPNFTKEREYDQKYLPGSYNRERKKSGLHNQSLSKLLYGYGHCRSSGNTEPQQSLQVAST